MATIDGQFEYSSTGDILKRIINSNRNSDSHKSQPNLYGNKLVDTSEFLDQAHEEESIQHSTVHQHNAGPSIIKPCHKGMFTVGGGVKNHDQSGGETFVCNDVNGEISFGSLDHFGSSASPRAHSISNLDQSDSSNSSTLQSDFLNISEGIDLDSLTPANLCRLSFADLANLTIVSLVQLQKYGQIILDLQQEVRVMREETESLKAIQAKKSKKQSTNSTTKSFSNAAENCQKLDAMLQKLPSRRVRDPVEDYG